MHSGARVSESFNDFSLLKSLSRLFGVLPLGHANDPSTVVFRRHRLPHDQVATHQPTNGDPRCTHINPSTTELPSGSAAILGSIVLSLAIVASAHAEEAGTEGSPNDLNCIGHISVGTPELGSEEQQVRYTFYCNGPITGYQLETNVPVTGFEASPLVTNTKNEATVGHVLLRRRNTGLGGQLRGLDQGRLGDDHRTVLDRAAAVPGTAR